MLNVDDYYRDAYRRASLLSFPVRILAPLQGLDGTPLGGRCATVGIGGALMRARLRHGVPMPDACRPVGVPMREV